MLKINNKINPPISKSSDTRNNDDMRVLLKQFEEKPPEIVFEWHDSETEAKGWVVINSLRGGAAGGGTRMRQGLDKNEVVSLAKTMEVKFTVSGPPIGGAKSGIDFDPNDPRKDGVLNRWFAAVTPLLKSYYGTAGDLNVNEVLEVVPLTELYGLWHPQEGVVNGLFHPTEPVKIHKIGRLREGVAKVAEDPAYAPKSNRKHTVSDLITGYGISESIRHFYSVWGGDVKDKRTIIQGWGSVASAAGYYLSKAGAKIVGIIDKAGGIIKEEGFSFEEIQQLFDEKKNNLLNTPDLIPFTEANERIWSTKAAIFVPAAASRLVSQDQLVQLIENGLEVISCGANVPFQDEAVFFGPTGVFADQRVAVIPDFIANCGMARTFAYLMYLEKERITDEGIFSDTSKTIEKALKKIFKINPQKTGIAEAAFTITLKQLI